ncbi:MAG: AAA family ATPase [Chloroflexia bacterium]|nr:AAA family ATPase [Chloroflexia bacterium]
MPTSPAHSALPVPVPPRPTEPGESATLPRPLTSFVGRARETEAVRALLGRDDVRLVTLTGPGGVGKTRLAQRVAEVLDGFPDGIWFVALAPVGDSALVAPTIAHVLGVRPHADQPVEQGIAAFLRDRHALLILDNFEHVLEAGVLVAELLARCPALTVLVTSRAVPRVSGERVFAVPPLALPETAPCVQLDQLRVTEAVRLFTERATASASDFALTADNAPAVVAICRRLDGLPLAIELAAARVTSISPKLLLGRLDESLRLLTGGPRDQPPRLRSMRDAIGWSYDLLDPDEQALFHQLAVFVGGWTLAAVEAVASLSPGASVFDTLASLIGKSLVRQEPGPDGASRYVMLETVREFALERLAESGEEAAIRGRHAAWCLAFAEDRDLAEFMPQGEVMLNQLEAEHANLRVALAWFEQDGAAASSLQLAGSLRSLWSVRGHFHEGRDWLERALAHGGQVPVPVRVRALAALSWILNQQKPLARALALAEEGLARAQAAGDRQGAVICTMLAGVAVSKLGNFDRAKARYEEALALLEALDNLAWTRTVAATLHSELGEIAIHQGDIARAAACFTAALARQRALGFAPGTSHPFASHSFAGLGDVARAKGDAVGALRHYQTGLGFAWRYRDIRGTANALGGTAGALAAMRQCLPAARLFGASEALHEMIGCPFEKETLDWQRAFGLPEPWAREGEPFGVAQALRDVLGERSALVRRGACDTETAAAAWSEGRALHIEDAIVEALAAGTDAKPAPDDHTGLTPRELDVLRLLADGKTDAEIAAALFISRRTAATHVRHIYDKLEVTSRAAAAAYAVRHGLA